MPSVEPNAGVRVLVTGANGYIAMWVIRTLLEQGYTVRGAVRSQEKGKRLRDYFSSYCDKVEWVIVHDITKDGAFDEAVKDIDAIEHMASPLSSSTGHPDEFIIPALHGTLGILKSALKFGTQVKRIVITSSTAAIMSTVTKPTVTFDENNWGDESVQLVKEQGKNAEYMVKYRASKTLAERAAWDFYNEHKNEVGWDLVTLQPPFPPLQEIKNPKDLNVSLAMFWDNIAKEKPDSALKATYSFIDVRDISAAHVMALRKEEAGGERIIITNGATTWQETRDLINSLQPKLYANGILPRGNPELEKTILYQYSPEKGKIILGLKYKSVEKMVSDTLADFEARGWLEEPVEGNIRI